MFLSARLGGRADERADGLGKDHLAAEPATRHGWSTPEWSEPYPMDGQRIQSRWFEREGDADELLQTLLMSDRVPTTMYRPLWCGKLWRVDRRHL